MRIRSVNGSAAVPLKAGLPSSAWWATFVTIASGRIQRRTCSSTILSSSRVPWGSWCAPEELEPLPLASCARSFDELDAQLPLTDVKPLGNYVGESLAAKRFLLGLLTTFSALAILLAGIGLYAVLSQSVQQRGREIGIRMALGAQGTDVLGLVARECFTIAGVGLSVGLFAAVWSSSLMKSMLFGVTGTDLIAYAFAILLLLLIVSAAAFIPAWRALRTDPVSALRYE